MLSGISSYEDMFLLDQGPSPMTSFNLYYFLTPDSPTVG